MRAHELNLRELLEFQPEAGKLLLGNERMIVFRSRAFGGLRRLLFDMLGQETARELLLRFGQMCGEGDFQAIGGDLPWDTPEDRAMAGPILHGWEGIVAVVPDTQIVPGMERMTGTWRGSYEAEIHLAEFGRAAEPVCYTLQGYAHGHASRAHGTPILCVETACRAMGDPECRWEMRPDEKWQDFAPAVALRQVFAATSESLPQKLARQMELVRQQRAAMMAMATPVIEVWDGVLALPILGVVDGDRAAAMTESLLAAIVGKRARCAILDLTGVETIDVDTAEHLLRMVRAARLLGSECLVSGISPAIAQTMTALGITIGLRTFPTLKDALHHATRASGGESRPARPHLAR